MFSCIKKPPKVTVSLLLHLKPVIQPVIWSLSRIRRSMNNETKVNRSKLKLNATYQRTHVQTLLCWPVNKILKAVVSLAQEAVLFVAVRQNETDLVVEATSSTGWLPVCASHIPDEFANRLCRELRYGQVTAFSYCVYTYTLLYKRARLKQYMNTQCYCNMLPRRNSINTAAAVIWYRKNLKSTTQKKGNWMSDKSEKKHD